MPRIFTILLLILITISSGSCEYLMSPASKLEHFVNRVDLHGINMTDEEWEEADHQMLKLQNDLDESVFELSEAEMRHLNVVMSRYSEIRLRYEMAKKATKQKKV